MQAGHEDLRAIMDDARVKKELYRNGEGHEVWRIYEERRDGSFLILHEGVASDHDAAWLMDVARHGEDEADRLEGERSSARLPRRCPPALGEADR
jgi:hypothetical protein